MGFETPKTPEKPKVDYTKGDPEKLKRTEKRLATQRELIYGRKPGIIEQNIQKTPEGTTTAEALKEESVKKERAGFAPSKEERRRKLYEGTAKEKELPPEELKAYRQKIIFGENKESK